MARILITGATGNLGEAIANAFADEANHLSLGFHRSRSKAEGIASRLIDRCESVDLFAQDLSIDGGPEKLVEDAKSTMGGIDSVIHLASIFERTPLGEVTPEIWQRTVDSNMKSSFFLAQEAGKAMGNDGGSMVFMSDTAASMPYAGYLPYCMAKSGVETMVKGLARILAPKIRINAVAPYIVTRPEGISDEAWHALIGKTPTGKPESPEEVASLIRWLALDARTTGRIMRIDEGRLLK